MRPSCRHLPAIATRPPVTPLVPTSRGHVRRLARSARSGRPRADRHRPRHHAVRGGGRRVGQDHRARRAGRRPRHRPGRWSSATSPPSPSRRRRAPSCATASGASWRRRAAAHRARGRPLPSRARRSSTAPPSARCTRSPSDCCPSTPSRPSCRRGWRCSTRCPPRWRSTGGGPASSTSCSTTPTSSARSSCSTPPTSTPASCARWPWPSSGRGTSSKTSCPSSAPSRRRSPTASPRSSASWPALAELGAECVDPTDKLLASVHEFADFGDELAAAGTDDLDVLEVLARGPEAPQAASAGRGRGAAAARTRCTPSSPPWSSTVDAIRRGVLDGCAHHLGSALARPRRSRPPTSAGPTAASSSTTCSCWPAGCCATRCRGRSCGRRSTSATSASCSTSSRTPTRSRSSWRCASPPPIPRGADEPQWARRRRSRPGACSSSATRSSRSTGSAAPTSRVFIAARERFAPEAGGAVELTANFRTVAPVIDWVNATFRAAAARSRTDEDVPDSQPDYIDLDAAAGAVRRRAAGGRHRHASPTSTAAAPTRCARPRAATSPT